MIYVLGAHVSCKGMKTRPGIGLTPFIPALGRQKPMDLYEFEASLLYIESSKLAKAA